ncbi:MAG TPA: type II toxin-antitoxin system PemK/MazF family toxin [Polyangiaceae bacterium]|nr:type II toxin-antitoxin system PemK/MazF family toxin [Polyangiaceae bacterium]
MADRKDIVELKQRLGFGERRSGERVVVVQATPLNAALPTTIVVPLDASPVVAGRTLGVTVSAAEAGTQRDVTALSWQVRTLVTDRLAPGRVGRLDARTMDDLDQKLRLVLGL